MVPLSVTLKQERFIKQRKKYSEWFSSKSRFIFILLKYQKSIILIGFEGFESIPYPHLSVLSNTLRTPTVAGCICQFDSLMDLFLNAAATTCW